MRDRTAFERTATVDGNRSRWPRMFPRRHAGLRRRQPAFRPPGNRRFLLRHCSGRGIDSAVVLRHPRQRTGRGFRESDGGDCDFVVIGSLILLNRENDNLAVGAGDRVIGQGRNIRNDGGPTIQAPGGILLASQCNGSNCPDGALAGEMAGNATVSADFTYVRGNGKACAANIAGCGGGSSTWTVPPTNNHPSAAPCSWTPCVTRAATARQCKYR